MAIDRRARLLRLHISESDRFEGRPLYEAIVDRSMEMGIAGATVFRGLEGFGESAEIHRRRLMGVADQPIVIVIIDDAEALERLIPAVEAMMGTGVIAVSDVIMRRVGSLQ